MKDDTMRHEDVILRQEEIKIFKDEEAIERVIKKLVPGLMNGALLSRRITVGMKGSRSLRNL